MLERWDKTTSIKDGHYELEIPFKEETPQLPDNKGLAEKRLQYLGKRLSKDERQHPKYKEEINALIEKGYAEPVNDNA